MSTSSFAGPSLVAGLRRDIRTGLARLELISHGPTAKLDKAGGPSTVEHPGGRRPGQDDREYASDLMEREDIRFAYQAKTVGRYERWWASVEDRAYGHDAGWLIGKLTEIRDDLNETLKAWRVAPVRSDGCGLTMADSGWKRYVWTSGRDSGDLAREFGCSRQYIEKVKAQDWSARNESRDDRERRERAEWKRRRIVV